MRVQTRLRAPVMGRRMKIAWVFPLLFRERSHNLRDKNRLFGKRKLFVVGGFDLIYKGMYNDT